MSAKSISVIVAVGSGLLGVASNAAALADESVDAAAERCVQLARIDKTKVVDDYNILFYLRGGTIYVNKLAHRCLGLKRENVIMYRTSLSQLCDLDIITVLYNQGFGFTPGVSCGLGRFFPISEDEAKALIEAPPRKIEEKEVEPAHVEDMKD